MAESTPDKQKVMGLDVSPGMQFYNLLESFPYNFTKAICEYVDNALQAFLDSKSSKKKKILDITFKFYSGTEQKIVIEDNGVGISVDDFPKALKPATRKDNPSLSEFGVGMKAASIWFGRHWELISSPIDVEKSYAVNFDLDRLLLNDLSEIDLYEVPYLNDSGVIITLSKLHNEITREKVENMWRKLQDIYQLFTHVTDPVLKLSAKFNGLSLERIDSLLEKYRNPDVLYFSKVRHKFGNYYAIGDARSWVEDIEFEFESKKVHGVFYVLKTAGQVDNPGIRLFRNKRLIQGFLDTSYRPKYLVGTGNKHAPSRVMAELHLDGQRISNNKGEFAFDEIEFLTVLKKIQKVKDLIEQAENYRAQAKNDEIHNVTEEEFDNLTSSKNKNNKNNKNKVVKPVIQLYRREDVVELGSDIDLYEYIKKATDKNGCDIDFSDIIIRLNGQAINSIRKFSNPGFFNIEYIYSDVSGDEAREMLAIQCNSKEIQIEYKVKLLIPHKASDGYTLSLHPVIYKLVSQLNQLYKRDTEYLEVIACSLRSCFELVIKSVDQSNVIQFSNKGKNFDDKVIGMHLIMFDNAIASIIHKSVGSASFNNFCNQYRSITEDQAQAYVKMTHLAAHGATDCLTPDNIEGLGNFLSLFLLVADQLLNNSDLQRHLNNLIPL